MKWTRTTDGYGTTYTASAHHLGFAVSQEDNGTWLLVATVRTNSGTDTIGAWACGTLREAKTRSQETLDAAVAAVVAERMATWPIPTEDARCSGNHSHGYGATSCGMPATHYVHYAVWGPLVLPFCTELAMEAHRAGATVKSYDAIRHENTPETDEARQARLERETIVGMWQARNGGVTK